MGINQMDGGNQSSVQKDNSTPQEGSNINSETFNNSKTSVNNQDGNVDIYDFSSNSSESSVEQLGELSKILKSAIEDLENEIETLESSSSSSWSGGGWDRPSATSSNNSGINDEQLNSLKEDLALLKMYQRQVDRQLELEEYNQIAESSSYQEFINNYNPDNIDINFSDLTTYDMDMYAAQQGMSTDEIDMYAVFEYIYNHRPEGTDIEYAKAMWAGNSSVAVADNFYFMTDEQRNMYHYLFQKEGKTAAEQYINLIQDDINKAAGAYYASNFINSLDMNDEGKIEEALGNYFKTGGKGFADGVGTFFDGLNNAIINNDQLTSSDYEKMIILEYLQENSNLLDETYEFSSALGNMAPALTASALVSFVGTPAAGAKTASALIGLSAYGNAKHQALIKGNDLTSSTIYGLLVGASEATLGYFLGKIPGISKYSGLTLKNLLMEGTEEFSQEWLDAGFRAVVLGENVDWSAVPEDATKSFIMGVMMAGLTNGGQSIVNLSLNGTETTINIEDTLKYIEENPNVDIMDALAAQNPGIIDFIKNRTIKSPNTESYNEQMRKVMTEIITLANSKSQAGSKYPIFDAINEYMANLYITNKDIDSLRMAARASIEFLKANGYNDIDAANALAIQYQNVLTKVGYDSYDIDGIEVNIIQNIDWSYQAYDVDRVMNSIKVLPPEMQQLVKTINIFDTYNPSDFYFEQKYDMQNFTAAATAGGGVINFWANQHFVQSTITHEIAHSYDTEYANEWGVNGRISESQLWLDAMQADLQLNGQNGVTEYARSSESSIEDFAESVMLYYHNPNALDNFPARKALLERYLPKVNTIAQDYDVVYNAMVNKFGEEETIRRIEEYINTGDINLFTRSEGARNTIRKYSQQEVAQYYESIKTQQEHDHNQAVKASFDMAFGALIRKYGANQAIIQMQKFIDTGNTQYITNSENARDQMTFSVEEYRDYLKSINGNSLEVSKLLGGGK